MNTFYQAAIQLKNKSLGTQKKFAPELINDPYWTMQVRALESEGISVSVPGNRHVNQRLFVAETNNGALKGFDLKGEMIEQIICTNIGLSHRSFASEPSQHNVPGLPYVPHHTMAIFVCKDTSKGDYEGPFFLPSSEIGVFLADNTSIQYGQGGFEGSSAVYDESGNICLFRIKAVCERFAKTAKAACLPPIEVDRCKQAIIDTVASNQSYVPKKDGKLYIRPFIMGTRGGFGATPAKECLIGIEVVAFGSFFGEVIKLQGLKDVFRPITGADKVSGNYTDSFARKKAVKKRGYNDYLSFDKNGNVEEVSTCAVGFIKVLESGKVEYHFSPVREDAPDPTQANDYHSLDSITRRSLIEILRRTEKKVFVRDIHITELSGFVGMFTMGNAAGVTPVEQVDICKSVDAVVKSVIFFGSESVDTLLQELKNLLRAARCGKLTDDRLSDLNTVWVDKI
jgi:branched-subunit amino acid aminotransferase/4-amino-4-deoxychorismate lyase